MKAKLIFIDTVKLSKKDHLILALCIFMCRLLKIICMDIKTWNMTQEKLWTTLTTRL